MTQTPDAPTQTRVDKSKLLAVREQTGSGFPEDDVTIEAFGTIHVRGLSRFEVLYVRGGHSAICPKCHEPHKALGTAAVEALTIHIACIDPDFSFTEVRTWQKIAPPGELDPLAKKIAELSGMLVDSGKKAYLKFEDDPGSEFRLLPGGEAEDWDGSGASDTDE